MNEKLYLCDPEKNVNCGKRGCFIRYGNENKKNACRMTRNPNYAMLDEKGEPIVKLLKECIGNGNPDIYKFPNMRNH